MAQMGSMKSMMKMIPGMAQVTNKQMEEAEERLKVYKSMIQSMTPKERTDPSLLQKTASRRVRVAKGSGRKEKQVKELLVQFSAMKTRMVQASKMMARMGGGGMTDEQMMKELVQQEQSNKVQPGRARRKKKLSKKEKLQKMLG
mmetsp:Transcript_31589/g.38170  ORF Transcript_31589/g.38170 Transcript_31589/m.38170 type:complete len:144 (+) Transcript_31589:3-434(+)